MNRNRLEVQLLGPRTGSRIGRVERRGDGPATTVGPRHGGPLLLATADDVVGCRVVNNTPEGRPEGDGRHEHRDDGVGGQQQDGAPLGALAEPKVRAPPGAVDLLEQDPRGLVERPHGRRVNVGGHA